MAAGICATGGPRSDGKAFEQRADCIVQEYGGFSPVPGVTVNGKLTLGENAADNGGFWLAFMALMDRLSGHPLRTVGWLTPQQQFFLGFCAVMVWIGHTGSRGCAGEDGPTLSGRVSREWHGPEYAGVLLGVESQGGRRDGFGQGLPDLVRCTSISRRPKGDRTLTTGARCRGSRRWSRTDLRGR